MEILSDDFLKLLQAEKIKKVKTSIRFCLWIIFQDTNFLLSSSKEIPLVSGIIKWTNMSCNTINPAKMENTTPGPILANKRGTKEGIIAANTQCTLTPNDCPELRR